MNKCVIYAIKSPSGKVYIGQSRNFDKRLKQYKRMSCITQVVLLNSFKKYGVENHTFDIIEECDIDKMNSRERYWQDYYNSLAPNGLNSILTKSNEAPRVVSKTTSKKLSDSKLGQKNPMYGRRKTDEEKKHLSNKFKGRVFTKEWIDKINASKIKSGNHKHGRKMSDDTKRMLKEALINKFSGFNNTRSRIVVDMSTGVFYYNVKDASIYNNINPNSLRAMLIGKIRNKTNLTFA